MYQEAAILQTLQSYGYFALFPILAFGGPLAALGAGFAASQGFFSPWIIWPLAVGADLAGDIFWYVLGRFGRERIYRFIKNFFSVADIAVANAERLFEHHGHKIIFFSKATMGFGFLGQFMLTMQGFLQIPFRVFLIYNFLAGIILSGAASFGGYYFGLALINTPQGIRLLLFLSVFAAVLFLSKIIRIVSSVGWLRSPSQRLHQSAFDEKEELPIRES